MDSPDGDSPGLARPTRQQRKIERRLFEVHARLAKARAALEVIDEQLAALEELAEDAHLRMLVSETSDAGRTWREADGHARRLAEHRGAQLAEIARLEAAQDDLFSQLVF